MEALLTSIGVVAIAEIGDRTQLLTLALAARFRHRPAPMIAGIVLATVANHALAAWGGSWGAAQLGPDTTRWIVGLSFLAFAAWVLIPDRDREDALKLGASGVFLATLVSFFVAEWFDKTQLATVALAANYAEAMWIVVAGTTLGMVAANVPVIYLTNRLVGRLPMVWIRRFAAAMFAVLGGAILIA